jgi:hypothetical protein
MCHYNKNVIQQTAHSKFCNKDHLTLHPISQLYYTKCNLPAILIDTSVIITKSFSVSGFFNFQCWKSSHKNNQIMQWILARYFSKKENMQQGISRLTSLLHQQMALSLKNTEFNCATVKTQTNCYKQSRLI